MNAEITIEAGVAVAIIGIAVLVEAEALECIENDVNQWKDTSQLPADGVILQYLYPKKSDRS